jgi:phosphatidylglycerophosphate synthase
MAEPNAAAEAVSTLELSTPRSRSVLVRNLANVVSILGVLPICLLFVDGGYRYVIPIIIVNNIMDDLDGILAVRLRISSVFGAALDNVCDAVAHVTLVLVIGMSQGGVCAVLSVVAVVSILLRVRAG